MDEHLDDVEHVRKRPGMYIGNTDFFGFIHYIVASVNVFLFRAPTRIDITLGEDCISIKSDVHLEDALATEVGESSFEKFQRVPGDFDGVILNALSRHVEVTSVSQRGSRHVVFEQGQRKSDEVATNNESAAGSTIRFQPDEDIFRVTSFSSYNFRSYLKRISFLHPSIRFSLCDRGEVLEYHSPGGVVDLFETISTPFQILHQPIHLVRESDDWKLEAVWAFHSWHSDSGFSFVNNGRAAEGGTHEVGREAAFDQLADSLRCPKDSDGKRVNGIIYALSLIYPGVVWQGCVKELISNPELESLVRDEIVEGSLEWIAQHPDVRREIPEIRLFNFPDIWMRK